MGTCRIQSNQYPHLVFIVALLIILCSGCGNTSPEAGEDLSSPSSESGETAEEVVSRGENPTEVPNPLQVTVRLDGGAQSVSIIPVSGGTISAAGSDSTRFTLSFPEHALLSDQEIRMTPISSIDGLPLSGG